MSTIPALIALLTLWPDGPVDEYSSHVEAATRAAAEYDLDADLLLAMAFVESNHSTDKVSNARGAAHCGPMQVHADSAEHCAQMRELDFGYHEGARTLRQWLFYARGDVRSALRGYGCGWQLADGAPVKPARPADHCNNYDGRVLRINAWITRAARVSLAS